MVIGTLAIGIHGRGNREEEKKCNFRYNLPHNAERAGFEKIISDNVKDMFRSSNEITSKLIKVELAEFGYDYSQSRWCKHAK